MIIFVYDRFGNQRDVLYDFVEFVHDDELGSFDSIEFMIPSEQLTKGDYLLWRDDWDVWHEHIVASCTLAHKNGAVYQQVYATNSATELNMSYINERDSYNMPSSTALTRLLENTRWELGTVQNFGNNSIKFYHETVYEGLCDISDKWGGDMSTRITVGANGVTHRYINHQAKRGEDNGLMFTYGFDMDDISRKIELDEIYTKIHCFGKGEQLEGGDDSNSRYGRRITFSKINGGKDYVEDNAAMQQYGVIGKDGKLQHSEGMFIWEDVEDPNELLKLGKEKLEEVKVPRITYSANIAVLADAGMNFHNVRTGDTVYIRDEAINERLTGRIVHVRRYLNNAKATEVTLGNIVRTAGNLFKQTQDALASMNKRSSSWDSAANVNTDWLDTMIDGLNEAMNAAGGYVYWKQGEGITVYDKPIDDGPTMAIQLKGGALRIANSRKSTGEWDWRTFGTGDGFTADVINAGTMRADRVRAGLLTDEKGYNYWNLETGEFRLSVNSQIGDKTIEGWTSSAITNFVNSVYDPKIAELQKQIDGQIETWYFDYEPKLNNKPASDWTTDAKKEAHEGDLFYWKSKGYAYRFFKDGNNWVWQLVQDTDITKAIADAATAKDVADHKRRVFITQPTTPYDEGDLYFQDADHGILTCIKSRATGNYTASDWQERNKYIDKATADKSAETAVDAQTQESIFNKLTNNGETKGVYLENKNLYVNADYIKTGTLSAITIKSAASDNSSNWNLATGKLTTYNMTANDISANGTFRCGPIASGSTGRGINISGGTMYGYYNGSQTGWIHFATKCTDTSGNVSYGVDVNGVGIVLLSSAEIGVGAANSSTYYSAPRGQILWKPITNIYYNSQGQLTAHPDNLYFRNGICMSTQP